MEKIFKPGIYFLRLPPATVSRNWAVMCPYIEQGLPSINAEFDEFRRGSLLKAILAGKLICWSVVDQKSVKECDILSFFTTTVYKDPVLESASLLIYSVTTIKNAGPKIFIEGLRQIREYAKAIKCSSISFYTPEGELGDRLKKVESLIKGKSASMHILEV